MFEDQIASARKEGFSDDEILNHIKSNKPDLAEKINGALKEKFSATDILNHFAPNSRPAEPGAFDLGYLGGQFKRGLGSAIEGYAKTAKVLGADAQNTQPFEQMGQNLQQGAPRSAMERFSNPGANDVTLGGKSLSALPGVIAEGGAGLIADLGAMAAGNAVAPGVGIALPIASYGAREYGRQLEERQANNGGAPVTGTDQATVGASVVAQGALNRLGLKGIAPGANLAERGLIDAGKRVATATGLEGATSAAQEGISQVGTVAGTSQGHYEPGRLVDAGLIGGSIGGTVRTAAEVGKGVRGGIAEVAKRGYEHQEVMPDVAAEINKISEGAGRKLGDRFDDAASLKEYADILKQKRSIANDEAVPVLKELFESQRITQDQLAKATAALTEAQPTKANIKVLEEVLGPAGKQELKAAIDFAKQSSVVEQLKTKSNFTDSKQTLFKGKVPYVSGGISRTATALVDRAKAISQGAMGGSLTYAGLAGLGSVGAATVALGKAAPVIGGLVGAYQATKLIDKALGTYSPVSQFVEHNIPKSLEPTAPGADLPSMRQERADQAVAKEQAKQQKVADIQTAREQKAQEKAASKEALDREALTIQSGGANTAQEVELSKTAKALADAQRKLDAKNGVQPDEARYATIESLRDPDVLPEALKRVTAELAMKKAQEKAPKRAKETVDPAVTEREAQAIQTGQANMAQETELAGKAKALSEAIRKLDEKNGIAPDEAKYASIESMRDPEFLSQALERSTADLKEAGKKASTAKAAKEKAPVQPGEPPKAKSKKTDEPKQAEPTNDKDERRKTAEVSAKDAYKAEVDFRQQMRDSTVSNFMKAHKFKGTQASYIEKELGKLNGTWGNIETVLANFKKMGERYKGLEKKLLDQFYEGGASNPDNYLNRTYKSKRLGDTVKTGKDADRAAGRRRKRDD